jgi:hypothetical protein
MIIPRCPNLQSASARVGFQKGPPAGGHRGGRKSGFHSTVQGDQLAQFNSQ